MKLHYHNFIFSKKSNILVLRVTSICQKGADLQVWYGFWTAKFILLVKEQLSTKELKTLTTYLLVLHRRFFKKIMNHLNSL